VETLRCNILAALLLVAGSGCSQHTAVVRRQTPPTPSGEPTWGEAAEGLQCRLRSSKHVYAPGENPTFAIDLRNRGGRIFAFRAGEEAPVSRFSIDGRWRRWPEKPRKDGRIRALGPGVEIADMAATLPKDARSLLTPGRHVVRLAFSFEGIDVVSNTVEIEIVGSP